MKHGLLAVLLIASLAQAEDFPGGSTPTEDEFSKGFAEGKGLTDKDHDDVNMDRLKIGGDIWAEWQILTLNYPALTQKDITTTPMTLNMYMDSQLRNDIRGFFRGRFVHDASIDETVVSPLTGRTQKRDTSTLEEMKISFNTAKRVFWTLGKQKIKWGASRFWNPTDFLNRERRNLLRPEDLRSGLSLVKAHVPIKNANAYFILSAENANQSSKTGSAARLELPFSLGEVTASVFNPKSSPTMVGGDLSLGVWDFDVYFEGAQTDDDKNKSATGGLTYTFKYSDDDTATLGLETFWQENGTGDISLYQAQVTAGQWIPFYVGKNYSMFSTALMNPGTWNNSNFLFFVIRNDIDKSNYAKLSWSYTGLTDMVWTAAAGIYSGDKGTEMKFFGQELDAYAQLKILF